MAEAKKAEGGEVEQPPKKKGKLLLIIVAAVVTLALIGGVLAFFLMSKHPPADEEGEEAPVKEEKVAKAKRDPETPPVFVKLEAFTVRLQAEGGEAYLQTVPELRVLDAPIGEKVKQYMPEIRHKVLLILSGKKASDLATPQGVQKLSNEIRVTINEIIEPPLPRKKGSAPKEPEEPSDKAGPSEPVQAVLFTSFIVQ